MVFHRTGAKGPLPIQGGPQKRGRGQYRRGEARENNHEMDGVGVSGGLVGFTD